MSSAQAPDLPSEGHVTALRKFRFAAGGEGNAEEGGARKFVKLAQQAEELGYDSFMIPDHLGNQVGPAPQCWRTGFGIRRSWPRTQPPSMYCPEAASSWGSARAGCARSTTKPASCTTAPAFVSRSSKKAS